jgi:hypothetical protein
MHPADAFVVAGGPVRDRGWIVGSSIDALSANGADALFYLANDCQDNTETILYQKGVRYETVKTGKEGYCRGERREGWKGHRYVFDHLADMRNLWADYALDLYPQATHFWSCDSDIAPDEDCLPLLLEADKPCIGARVRNSPVAYNFMLGMDSGGARRSGGEAQALESTEPFEVTLTGACFLIRRDVLESTDWGFHDRGEDLVFSQGCIDQGHGLWLHPRARCTHYMGQTPDEVWY